MAISCVLRRFYPQLESNPKLSSVYSADKLDTHHIHKIKYWFLKYYPIVQHAEFSRCSSRRLERPSTWLTLFINYSIPIHSRAKNQSLLSGVCDHLWERLLKRVINWTVVFDRELFHYRPSADQRKHLEQVSEVTIQCAAKKVSPKVVCHFLSNHLEFLCEIFHIYYLFIYT